VKSEMSESVIVAIITGTVTLIGAFLMALPGIKAFRDQQQRERKETIKVEAEAIKIYSDLLRDSIQSEINTSEKFSMLQERLDTIEHEFRELLNVVYAWASGIDLLVHQIESKQETPTWKPDPKDIDKVKKLKQSIKSRLNES
jgi:hypothetical protein